MKDRIKKVRKTNNLTMEQFGNRIGITKSSVSLLESGKNSPSEQTLKLICKEFNINMDWLQTGNGDMNKEVPNKFSFYLGQIEGGSDEFIQDLIEVYMELDVDSKKALRIISEKMAEKRKNRGQN